MGSIQVLYATREGQTRRIAEHIAAMLRARALDVDVRLIAWRERAHIDTARNTEYTDWQALDRLVDQWPTELGRDALADHAPCPHA